MTAIWVKSSLRAVLVASVWIPFVLNIPPARRDLARCDWCAVL